MSEQSLVEIKGRQWLLRAKEIENQGDPWSPTS